MDEDKKSIDGKFTETKEEADQNSEMAEWKKRYQEAHEEVQRQNRRIERMNARLDAMADWLNARIPYEGLERFARNVERFVWIGIILHVITYFWPELPEKIPTIYAVYDGWIQLMEYGFRATFSGIYALFTGKFFEWLSGSSAEIHQLVEQFISWMASL